MYKLGLEKAEEPMIKLPTFARIIEKAREFQKSICFIDYLKAFDLWITTNYERFLKRWEYQTTLPVSEKLICRLSDNSYNLIWNN